MGENTINIFSSEMPQVSDDEFLSDDRWQKKASELLQAHAVDVTVLENNVRNFFVNINSVLCSTKEVEKAGFSLQEIEFTLQFSAEGQVGFLVTRS